MKRETFRAPSEIWNEGMTGGSLDLDSEGELAHCVTRGERSNAGRLAEQARSKPHGHLREYQT